MSTSLHDQAIGFLHKGEYQKVINVVTKNIYKQTAATPESILYGNFILSDALFAMAKHDEAQEIIEKSIVHPAVQSNWGMKNKLFRKLQYYVTRLHPKIVEIRPWMPLPNFNFMNASLYLKQDNMSLVSFIRATNYTKKDRKEVRNDVWNRIVSRNFVYIYDYYFRILFHKEIEDYSIWPRNSQSPVLGYEDPRVIYHNNTYYFTATSLECNRMIRPCIVLCKLDSSWNITTTVQLQCQHMNDMQKNWLPFVDPSTNKLLVIYRMSPFIINEINMETGGYTERVNIEMPHIHFPTVRGSTSPIQFENGWLFVVHFVNYDDPSEDIYYSKFVWMSKDFIPKKISATFSLEHKGIEYISGLAIWKDMLYVAYNTHDTQSKLSRLSVDAMKTRLKWYDIMTGKQI